MIDAGPEDSGPVDAGPEEDSGPVDAGPSECEDDGDCASGACATATCVAGMCRVQLAEAGTECRASAGACDVAEVCDGASAECPADTFVAADTECRASAGACDVAEVCDGASAECPADALAAADTECRTALASACGVAAMCTGEDGACPDDGVCEPPATFTYEAWGRRLQATVASIGDGTSRVVRVAPGATVSYRFAGSWAPSAGGACPTCQTQFYVRVAEVHSSCLGNAVGSLSFDVTETFEAPTEPGYYFVQVVGSWQYGCEVDVTAAPTSFGPSTVFVVVVE